MNSSAVHIEIADSMDTSSCINALRRFLARRGHVKEITSDNGTNFVGANHQLSEAIKELDEVTLQRFASSHEIQWKFNTPSASPSRRSVGTHDPYCQENTSSPTDRTAHKGSKIR